MRWAKRALGGFAALAALLSPAAGQCDDSFQRALALASEQRYSEAREVLDPLLEREPGHARARVLDGILEARSGHLDGAIEAFEAIRRDHPDMLEPYNNLAVIYAVQGRLEDARTTLLAILERRPDAVVYANLGDVYTRLARRAYQRARELDPGGDALLHSANETAFALPLPPDDSVGTDVQQRPVGSTDGVGTQRESASVEPELVMENRVSDGDSDGARPAVSGTTSADASFCALAGGFGDRRTVADAALWLQSFGAEVLEVRHEERQVVGSYRVYLPPLASREKAAATVREIRARGVRDVAVIGDGTLANGISFGIFRSADNLHRRMAALGGLGFAVRSVPEEVRIVEDYVIRARAGGAPAALDAAWTPRFPGTSIEIVDCG